MSQHTPGPWEVVLLSGPHENRRRIQFVSGGRGVLMVEHDGSPEGMANEVLAKAAPELLAALRDAITDVASGRTTISDLVEKRARSAIARAEGRLSSWWWFPP